MQITISLEEWQQFAAQYKASADTAARVQVLNEHLQEKSMRDRDALAAANTLLGDARAQVDRLHREREERLRASAGAAGAAVVAGVAVAALLQPILDASRMGCKTDLIRAVRDVTQSSLADAKRMVEGNYAWLP